MPLKLAVSILAVCFIGPNFACDQQLLKQCGTKFMAHFGFHQIPSPTDFLNAMDSFTAKYGKAGFRQVCSWTDELFSCGGTDVFPNCMSLQSLQSMGLTYQSAVLYAELYKNLAFSCGPGYSILYDHYDCILSTNKTDAKVLAKCGQDFVNGVTAHPDKACTYAQTFVECIAQPFTSDCGATVGWAVCQQQKRMVNVPLPQCKLICSS